MAIGTVHVAILTLSIIGLCLNASEQVMLLKKQDLRKSFTILILLLSVSDCFICLSSIGRVIGIALDLTVGRNSLYDATSFSLVLLGFLGNSTIIWLMTIERLMATCFPFKHRRLVTKGRTVRTVGLLWTLSTAISVLAGYLQCKSGGQYLVAPQIMRWFFITTFVLLLTLYSIIFIQVRQNNLRQTRRNQTYNEADRNRGKRLRNKQQRRILNLSCRIVSVFFLCHSLFIANSLFNPRSTDLDKCSFTAAGVCLIITVASVDPLLYFFNIRSCQRGSKGDNHSTQISSSTRASERGIDLKDR